MLLCVVGLFPVLNGSLVFAQQQDSSEIFVIKNPAASKYINAVTIDRVRIYFTPRPGSHVRVELFLQLCDKEDGNQTQQR